MDSNDLFSFLRASTLYPKIYWAGHGAGTASASVGEAKRRKKGRMFAFRHFIPTKAAEWLDFSSAAMIAPRCESIRRVNAAMAAEDLPDYFVRKIISSHSRESWKRQIEQALAAIGQKLFQKVVLARRVSLFCSSMIDPVSLCRSLQGAGQTVFLFQPTPVSAFLGATPEMLYRRSGRQIVCDALAGTRPIRRQNELPGSEKDIREFSVVQNQILEALSPFCETAPQSDARSIRTTPHLAHLSSQIQATLKDGVTDELLLSALHPTPAVGGHPRQNALSFIEKTEPFARGLYAAPIGWTSALDAEFAVGIRSCLILGSTAHLFAGSGIVAGSDPSAEWDETEHKLSQFINLFRFSWI